MKIIAIGDPHIHIENLQQVDIFISKMKDLCEKETPDLIVILGDVLHTHERLHTMALNKAVEFFDAMRQFAYTYILVGNHDLTSNQSFLNQNHWMNCLKDMENVSIVDKVMHAPFNNLDFIFSPYVSNGRFEEALNTISFDWKKADLIFAHQEFLGCKMGAIQSVDGDAWSDAYPQVISGHIHSKQRIGKKIYYSGSAMQNAFGESESNTIPIINIEKENQSPKIDIREIDLGMTRKRIVYSDISDITTLTLPKTDDEIKLTITGNYEEIQAFRKTKKFNELKATCKIVFKPSEEVKIELPQEIKTSEIEFVDILRKRIYSKKDVKLVAVFEKLLYNRDIDDDSIVFL